MGKVECHVVIPDTHRPFHDERAEEVVHRAIEVLKPAEIDLGGDYADFYEISDFDKSPGRKHNLKTEILSVRAGLRAYEGHRAKRLVFCVGNHEHRLARYITKKCPELYDFITLEAFMTLEKWKVVPYRKHHRIGAFHLTHDCGYFGVNAHRQSRQQYEGNVGVFHNHRLASEYKSNLKGKTHVGMTFGWLGDKAQVDYTHEVKSADWSLGFGVLHHELATGNVHAQLVPIIDYTACVNGTLVRATPKRTYAK